MIRCVQVSKVYNADGPHPLTALREIDLAINGEGVVVFRGPSGSGKTTLLSVLGCLSRPTTGRLWINDTEVSGLSEGLLARLRRECFGFLFQDFQLIPRLSVLTNVMLPLYPTPIGHRALRTRALSLLAELELESKTDDPVGHLSAGEQQRVALARALVNHPPFLLADEPTAHLDSALSLSFLNLVDRLRRRGTTVLLASHDPRVFNSPVIQRVHFLRDGQLREAEDRS